MREVVMYGFNLLVDFKEIESMKHLNHTFEISNNTPKRHLNQSEILPQCATDILDILTFGHSHAIGMPASTNLWMLS